MFAFSVYLFGLQQIRNDAKNPRPILCSRTTGESAREFYLWANERVCLSRLLSHGRPVTMYRALCSEVRCCCCLFPPTDLLAKRASWSLAFSRLK